MTSRLTRDRDIVLIIMLAIVCYSSFCLLNSFAQPLKQRPFSLSPENPQVFDPNLKVEEVVEGLAAPTTMAFIGPDDFLVLEKDKGTVVRVVNGQLLDNPVLDVSVANSVERGMCGIAVSKTSRNTYVFLYFTEIKGNDGDDKLGKAPLGNRIYKYELDGNMLVNPQLLMDLPAIPGPRHNGGALEIGPDDNLYIPIGDVDGSFNPQFQATHTQNSPNAKVTDGRSGILRITQDGKPVGKGILGDSMPLRLYYAYGIRNSFGLAFDPLSGNLWETENGPQDGDEINFVKPGFNSGWNKIYGLMTSPKKSILERLTTFDGKGKYEDPKLVWPKSTGLTGIIFFNSEKFGSSYTNDMFVGAVHNGIIYHFELNSQRDDLSLPKVLSNRYMDINVNTLAKQVVFGNGFGGITDLTVGPDGYLYIVSISSGKVYRILPN